MRRSVPFGARRWLVLFLGLWFWSGLVPVAAAPALASALVASPPAVASDSSAPSSNPADHPVNGPARPGWTLEQCLDVALAQHPSLAQARAQVAAARAGLGQVAATLKPKLEGSANWSHSQIDARPSLGAAEARALADRVTDSYSAGLTYRQLLHDWGRTRQRRLAGEARLSAQEAQTRQATLEVINGVTVAFAQVLQSEALVQVQREAVQRWRDHLARAQGLVEAGARPPYDITKAELDLANATLALTRAESARDNASARLSRAIGLDGAVPVEVPAEHLPPVADPGGEPQLERLLAVALTERPDLAVAAATRGARRAALREVDLGMAPTLSGSVRYDWSGTVTPADRGWNGGVSLSKPFLDGRLQGYQRREAEANLAAADASFDQARVAARAAVVIAYNTLIEARERVRVARTLVQQASETLHLAEGRYQAGVGSAIEVTDARAQYIAARGELAGAVYDTHIAVANLELAVGMPLAMALAAGPGSARLASEPAVACPDVERSGEVHP